jgi:hypothetical protein
LRFLPAGRQLFFEGWRRRSARTLIFRADHASVREDQQSGHSENFRWAKMKELICAFLVHMRFPEKTNLA